jgi:hypothetical protein
MSRKSGAQSKKARRTEALPESRRAPNPLPEPEGVVRWYDHSRIFAGPRPVSARRGLEPAFLLIETEVMEALQARAAQRGLSYAALVRLIVREPVQEY